MSDLCIVLLNPVLRVFLTATVSGAEDACGDIVSQQLLIYHIDDGRDNGFDVFLTINQGGDIVYNVSC